MKTEEQNRAIAKWLHPTASDAWIEGFLDGQNNFSNDLNAMIGVLREKVCGDKEMEQAFLKELKSIHDRVADSEDIIPVCEWDMVLVVSECDWLAEALLRSIGKYSDPAQPVNITKEDNEWNKKALKSAADQLHNHRM